MKLLKISLSVLSIAHGIIVIGMESNKRSYQQNRIYTPSKKPKAAKPAVSVYCPICKRALKNIGALELHNPTHDMTRPYTCVICTLGFVSELGLITHQGTQIHKEKEKLAKKSPVKFAVAEALLTLSVKKS